MRKIEIGDTLMSQGTVVELDVDSGLYRITSPTGSHRWVHECNYQLVETPPLSVGDRMVTDGGSNVTIKEVDRHPRYRIKFPDGTSCWRDADQLKPAPPKPEYRAVRVNDELLLQRINDNPEVRWSARVPMSDPEAVGKTIVAWADGWGIDADEARKLAAKPQIIGDRKLHDYSHATAIRHGGSWCVYITTNSHSDANFIMNNGTAQPDSTGKGIFPKTEGPYEVKP